MKKYVMPAIVAAAVVTGAPALAADLKPVYKAAPAPVAFNPWDVAIGGGLMTDYNFRGIRQSDRTAAVTAYFEGRFNPTKDMQWYAGAVGYSVKLATDPAAEIDLYGGARFTFDKFTLDLGCHVLPLSGRASDRRRDHHRSAGRQHQPSPTPISGKSTAS